MHSLIADLDQAALYGALIRIQSLGLELTEPARNAKRGGLTDSGRRSSASCHRGAPCGDVAIESGDGCTRVVFSRGGSELYRLPDRIQNAALHVIRHYAPGWVCFSARPEGTVW